MRTAQGRILKLVSFANWAVLTLAVLASLIGAVICLLIWPFPQVADNGARLSDIVTGTELAVAVALVAALATWLTDKRHPAFWVAEVFLLGAIGAALYYGLAVH